MAKLKEKKVILGFTLVEMLVAVSIFTFLAVVSTQILALSLRGVTKSQNIAETRENIDNAVLTIDRLLRGAVSCTDGSTTLDPSIGFEYQDSTGNNVAIKCEEVDGIGFISWNDERLTSSVVDINCGTSEISCTQVQGRPGIVEVSVTGTDTSHGLSSEGSQYTNTSRTLIRNYSSN